jgi:glycolate oxidase iron-sulfur subunit
VQYGEILELAREKLDTIAPNEAKHAVVEMVTDPKLMSLGSRFGPKRMPASLSKAISGEAPVANLPRPHPDRFADLDESELPPVRGEVYMLEGCAMRSLFASVNAATERLLRRIGYAVRRSDAGCCGSMHAHNGYLDEARERAEGMIGAMPDDLPVIVNSAGCGSTMKRYGELLADGAPFANCVWDASEFLAANGLLEVLAGSPGLAGVTVTYHDACHLAHGQRIKDAPRQLIASIPGITLAELGESDMCCGSAGIYNITQPTMARQLLDRKMANIVATGASIVATGNPGCHAWIEQGSSEAGGPRVMHTLELLEMAWTGR